MAILVTGGAGYIGSHTCVELLDAGYDIVVVDNYSNSHPEALHRVEELTGRTFPRYNVDLLDKEALNRVFAEQSIDAVLHFAGLKAVGESVGMPLRYYHNNITGTLNLCDAMKEHGVYRLVFSSSATVYGMPESAPIPESAPVGATNPYGRTKQMIEEMLRDLSLTDSRWSIALLRYFNPVGAHKSGRIGENPNGIPNNLMPYITQVAVGKLPLLKVFGSDYPTPDGTGVRDYIHVTDLAIGHLRALEKTATAAGTAAYNLGTGRGFSVLELIEAFQKASGRVVPYVLAERRPGDIALCYADTAKAEAELGWTAARGIAEMCEDSWRWQSQNPSGFERSASALAAGSGRL
ncbi:UDP-glucose 4-epimerase GalE [Gorillibacterium timonense]|uniref:UDP-glucose 4-epimerase GalE n=1 Tax=Gorillibacterium timonense TaxID=1689269 RepID=UPI00071CB5E8|nr:UDP-glucose 4-epimerase GalE [Gorillibacterium timonense]